MLGKVYFCSKALFTRSVCVCVNNFNIVPMENVGNGFKPILCMCVCVTINTMLKLMQTLTLTQTQTLSVNKALRDQMQLPVPSLTFEKSNSSPIILRYKSSTSEHVVSK